MLVASSFALVGVNREIAAADDRNVVRIFAVEDGVARPGAFGLVVGDVEAGIADDVGEAAGAAGLIGGVEAVVGERNRVELVLTAEGETVRRCCRFRFPRSGSGCR